MICWPSTEENQEFLNAWKMRSVVREGVTLRGLR
jgi:hypothetical protein